MIIVHILNKIKGRDVNSKQTVNGRIKNNNAVPSLCIRPMFVGINSRIEKNNKLDHKRQDEKLHQL